MKPKNRNRLTPEIREKMVGDRKKGLSYSEIGKTYGFSRATCTIYLKDIPVEQSYTTEQWKLAEREAEQILSKNGFKNILNLNQICASPYWDYYVEKGKERWLIDVTINERKSVVDKYGKAVKGFNCAILHKQDKRWVLVEIKSKEIYLRS